MAESIPFSTKGQAIWGVSPGTFSPTRELFSSTKARNPLSKPLLILGTLFAIAVGMSVIIRVLLVDDKVELRQNIKRLLSFDEAIEIVGEAGNGREAIEQARKTRPDLILMDLNMPVMDGIQATEVIARELPEICSVMMSVQGENQYIRRAMQAGARDYLVKPFSNAELVDTIKNVYQSYTPRRELLQQQVATAPPEQRPIKRGEVFVVFGSKGGSGRTTLALNLAVALKRVTQTRVCIVDCDLQFGDVGLMLNLHEQLNICDLISEPPPWTSAQVSQYVISHQAAAIDVLLGPPKPEYAETVEVEHVEEAIKLLQENYDYVIVDTSPQFRSLELAILDMSALIFVLLTPEMSSIKCNKLCLDLLLSLNYDKEKIKVVLNKGYPTMGGIGIDEVQRALQLEVESIIPSAGNQVLRSINKGIPFMVEDQTSDLAKAYFKLAKIAVRATDGILPDKGARRKRNSLFDTLKDIFSTG